MGLSKAEQLEAYESQGASLLAEDSEDDDSDSAAEWPSS